MVMNTALVYPQFKFIFSRLAIGKKIEATAQRQIICKIGFIRMEAISGLLSLLFFKIPFQILQTSGISRFCP